MAKDAASMVSVTSVRWMRSTPNPNAALVGAPNCVVYSVIEGETQYKYQLTEADIDCYIKACVTVTTAPASVAVGSRKALVALGSESDHESSVVLGPVVAAPPRLITIKVAGERAVGGLLVAETEYVGGFEGASEYWWMRIREGERETLSDPRTLTVEQQKVTLAELSANPTAVTTLSDPRAYAAGASDKGCVFKVKCRPVRRDGYRGEVFTSKPSTVIADHWQ